MERLAEARSWASAASFAHPTALQLRLLWQGTTVSVPASAFAWKGGEVTAAGSGLLMSVDGLAATSLSNWLQGRTAELLGWTDRVEGETLAVRHKGHVYGLEVLYHAAELLEDEGEVEVVVLSCSFAWREDVGELRSLQLLMQAEAHYYSSAEGGLEASLKLIEEARLLDPGNALIELRRGAALFRLGNRRNAIACLVAQQRLTPRCGKIYYRIGMMLIEDESTLRSALCTMHGGLHYDIHRTRSYSKILSLARKCVLLIWGPVALGASSGNLSNVVLQMVLDELPIWDVLRVSCVCFSWSAFASQNNYWARRLICDFGIDPQNEKEFCKVSCKERYRLALCKNAQCIRVVGWAVPQHFVMLEKDANVPGFYLFEGIRRDVLRMVWMGWLRYLTRRGLSPKYCAAFFQFGLDPRQVPFEQVWTLGGAVLNHRFPLRGYALVLPSREAGFLCCSTCSSFIIEEEKHDFTCFKRHAVESHTLADCITNYARFEEIARIKRVVGGDLKTSKTPKQVFFDMRKEAEKYTTIQQQIKRFYVCCGQEDASDVPKVYCSATDHAFDSDPRGRLHKVVTTPFIPFSDNNVDCSKDKVPLLVNNLASNIGICDDSPLTGLDVKFAQKASIKKNAFMVALATQQVLE